MGTSLEGGNGLALVPLAQPEEVGPVVTAMVDLNVQQLEAVGQLCSLQKVLLEGHLNRASPWQLHPCK